MAHPRHQWVRQRYGYRCGYCGVSETDVGGELTVDHFQPVSAGGDDSDDNLVHACPRCNQYKSDFHPSADDLANGRRLLHPLRDDLTAHIRRNEQNGMLEPLTQTGRFHITVLQLNRPALVAHRREERIRALMTSTLELLMAENRQLHETVALRDLYIAHLRQLAGLSPEEQDKEGR